MPLPTRMVSPKDREEMRHYDSVARGVRTIGVIEESQEDEDGETVWRGAWRNGPVVVAVTPDIYESAMEALRAAATYLVQATNAKG